MRVVRVEVQRLLGFKNVDIEIDSALQLVAGPNNAGKSTLVRSLELFFSDPSTETLGQYRPLNDYYALEGPRALSRVTVHFGDLTNDEQRLFQTIIRQREQTFSISLRATRTGTITFDASKKPGADEARRYYNEVLSRFQFVKIPSIRVADGNGGDSDSLERLLDTLESVLIRKGSARSTGLQQQFAQNMQQVDDLVRNVLDHSAAAIQDDLPFQESAVQFRIPDPRHALRGMLRAAVIESHGTVVVPVASRGTGFQSALVLGILRYVAGQEAQSDGNILFAIEEPEAFLHPQTQRAMAKIIRDISADAQVLVTTHSSVLVDSFEVDKITRLPLQPGGLVHEWAKPALDPTDVGRLSRYCSAANSELIFANAVVFVEGEGDHTVLERLFEHLCGGPGGHYAHGITVIEAGGVSKIRYLVQLAEMFGVRSYVLADRDSLHKAGGKRQLIEILAERSDPPENATLDAIRNESDKKSLTLRAALARQKRLNNLLAPYRAFVLAADLEGLLLDMFDRTDLVARLGPEGHDQFDQGTARKFLQDADGEDQLRAWLGSKGWNSTSARTGKLEPHIPALLITAWIDQHTSAGAVLAPLLDWLREIVQDAALAPV